jgi:hypothetical protein
LNSKSCLFSKVRRTDIQTLDSDPKKWQILYLAKIRACQNQIADFTDPKKDLELKEDKKECLIELIDVLDESDAATTVLVDKVLTDAFQMIGINLFRAFANKSKTLSYSEILENKKTSAVDPDEDEPHLEESWPHM